jgi:hypothetical protein
MKENVSVQEGGCALPAAEREWLVPFQTQGSVLVVAGSPEEAGEIAAKMGNLHFLSDVEDVRIGDPTEVSK